MIKYHCALCGCEIDYNTFIFELVSSDFTKSESHEICTNCYLKAKSILEQLKGETK